tara:strand:- start:59 stop:649 length:591 start_codon:yes stop_codon:yes gene_type:complete
MKRLLPYLFIVLSLGLTFNVKANNIENFQIEKISIGDSLLDHFSIKFINKNKKPIKVGKKKFKEYNVVYKKKGNQVYDLVRLVFKADNTKYIISEIVGRKYYKNNINQCYKTQNIISNNIEKALQNSEKIETGIIKNKSYPNGDSYIKDMFFYLNNKDIISIKCYDYSKKDTRNKDRLNVKFFTREYLNWNLSKKK